MARTSSNPAAVCNLPQHTTMVQRIKDRYADATIADIHAGYAWYREAQDFARALAAATKYPQRAIAGIIAALSPQSAWYRNKLDATTAVEYHYASGDIVGLSLHTKSQMGKVGRILDGETPEGVLRGPKESAFYRNIMGDYSLVTVDRWAFKSATGVQLPDSINGKVLGGIGKGAYKRIHAAYVQAAQELNVPPAVLQAIVWIVERGSAI